LLRLLHKTCPAGILPQSKTNPFLAPRSLYSERGVFLWGLFYNFFIGFSCKPVLLVLYY
jgi:hypothetical protein